VSYLYKSGYLIKVGLGLGEDAFIALALFYLCLLGCQSWLTILTSVISDPFNESFCKKSEWLGARCEAIIPFYQQVMPNSTCKLKQQYQQKMHGEPQLHDKPQII